MTPFITSTVIACDIILCKKGLCYQGTAAGTMHGYYNIYAGTDGVGPSQQSFVGSDAF